MKIKKYIFFLLILLILINITSINAIENNTEGLETNNENPIEIDGDILSTSDDYKNDISQKSENIKTPEILTKNNDDQILSYFLPASTQLTLTINDTSELETTGNITINMHLSFTAIQHNGEFKSQNIIIYENNTLIKTLNIGELNLPELGITTGAGAGSSIPYQADISFNYTIHDNSYLTTSLFGVYSNTLQFEKIKNIEKYTLNNTNILINNQPLSTNNTLSNNITSLKKALELIKNNETLTLNNINFIQDTNKTLVLNKDITITGNNVIFTLQNKGLLFEINPNTSITFLNLTFIGNNPNIIKNNGNVKLLNCTFKENNLGLITNNGELEITNTKFQEINQIYLDRLTSNQDGLIKNYGTLKITNTSFTNNNDLLPYNIPIESETIKAIIYNKGILTINSTEIKNLKDRILYNDGKLLLTNTLIENINPTGTTAIYKTSTKQTLNNKYTYNTYRIYSKTKTVDGAAIYNNDQINIINTTFQSTTGSNGGAIYNNKEANITDTIFQTIKGGTIYTAGTLNMKNTLINDSTGRAISNNGILTIINSEINKGSGIYNNNQSTIINTTFNECNGVGSAIYNNHILNIENCQITNNQASADVKWRYEEQSNGQIFQFVDKVYSGVIYNGENANANITKSTIKNNILNSGPNGNWRTYYGNIKNDGTLKISGCIFDNNNPYWDGPLYQGDGSFNIYNTGKITVMYSYLVNTKIYTGEQTGSGVHSPHSFLYNTGKGTCNINYNFFCLNAKNIIRNANPNYYFILGFDDDYYPIKLNENTNITLSLKLTNGEKTIEFNDWDKLPNEGLNTTITTINEKGEWTNTTTLLKNYYTFNFNYTKIKGEYVIYTNILNNINSTLVDVGKEFPEMTVTYNNITYNDGNNITFHIKVAGNLTVQPTGNITLTYNNQKITINLTEGECNYTITEKLKPANYTMRIDYNGDSEYFRIIKQYYPFTVHKIPTNITLIAPEIKIGETGHATITITPGTSKLIGYLYVNGVRKTKADTTSTRTLNLNNYGVGIYNLTVIFDEDEYYTGGTASTLFTVGKWKTNLNVTADDVKPGENTTVINITINPGDVRGEAIVEINGKNETVYLNDTTTRIPVTDLEEGTYTVTVYYPGDAKYAPSNGTATFSVARITSKITCEISYDEHMNGHVTVNANHNNCTGEVRLYINNDDPLKLNLTDGKANFTVKFKRGVNYIYIYYYGDEYYSFSTWNRTFTIDATPVLSLETQDLRSNSTGYVRINLTDTNNIPYEYTDITIEFNNQTTTLKTDENGTVYYPVQLPAGKYSIKATYGNATIIKNITVKTTTRITVEIASINQDEDLMAYVTLTDYNNQKITGDVILEINGQYYKIIVTNGAGSRNLGEMKAGNYKYNATYIGEGLLASSQTTGTFNVAANNYRITGNKNINAYYGANKNYKIQLLNNNKPVKDAIITIKINKNTVQVKTDNQGYATLKLTLKPGKYTITSTCKNVKATNKITVKKTLITKNKKIKKGKTLTYTAKLLNKNGKKLKNKKITFKINGKKYKAKTNKKGIAKIKVKNLKKGKYKIKTSYGKLKNTNTITVK